MKPAVEACFAVGDLFDEDAMAEGLTWMSTRSFHPILGINPQSLLCFSRERQIRPGIVWIPGIVFITEINPVISIKIVRFLATPRNFLMA